MYHSFRSYIFIELFCSGIVVPNSTLCMHLELLYINILSSDFFFGFYFNLPDHIKVGDKEGVREGRRGEGACLSSNFVSLLKTTPLAGWNWIGKYMWEMPFYVNCQETINENIFYCNNIYALNCRFNCNKIWYFWQNRECECVLKLMRQPK